MVRRSRRVKVAFLAAAVAISGAGTVAASFAGGSDGAARVSSSAITVSADSFSTTAPVLFYIAGSDLERVAGTDQIAPNGKSLVDISAEGDHGLPETAKTAYQRAARNIETTRPGCNLPWTLLAGIGRVESDHGRFGGSVLGTDGYSRPRIRGVALNGVGPVAAIRDSDNGKLDGDKVWDRAVGPMQFIPTTWAVSGRDGDRDGVSDPNDIDDASLAAAGYLCPSSGSIDSLAAKRTAVFSYNRSDYYVDLVLAFANGYQTGVFALPSPPVPEPEEAEAAPEEKKEEPKPKPKSKPEPKPSPGGTPGGKPEGTNQGDKNQNSGGQGSGPSKNDQQSGGGKTSGPGTGGKGGGSTPTPPPSEPTQEPFALRATSGAWTGCGATWCISGFALDLGSGGQLDRPAVADFDGDGAVESNRAEFTGMVGTVPTVHVKQGTNVVYIVKGSGYRNRDGSFSG